MSETMDCESSSSTDNSGYSQVELHPDGSYKSFVAEVDTEWVIGARPITLRSASTVRFYANGNLRSCVLLSDARLEAFGEPVMVAGGTSLLFHESGAIGTLTLAPQPRRLPWASKKWSYRGSTYAPRTTLEFAEDGAVVAVHE